jgi:AraC family transcriptional regulator, transcriptional activator of pobA
MSKQEVLNYDIHNLTQLITGRSPHGDLFSLQNHQSLKNVLNVPYRNNFYSIGMALEGSVRLKVNLLEYQVAENQLIIIPPLSIRTWQEANGFQTQALFFEHEFLNPIFNIGESLLFENEHIINLPVEKLNLVKGFYVQISQLQKFSKILSIKHTIAALIVCLQDEIVDKVIAHKNLNRPTELVQNFKKLVGKNYLTIRQVADYADMLAVSPKHLSETVKVVTNRTPTDIIDEMLFLEAKVLLLQTHLSISEISYYLNFSDQSAFGKFFRRHTEGISPSDFRKI